MNEFKHICNTPVQDLSLQNKDYLLVSEKEFNVTVCFSQSNDVTKQRSELPKLLTRKSCRQKVKKAVFTSKNVLYVAGWTGSMLTASMIIILLCELMHSSKHSTKCPQTTFPYFVISWYESNQSISSKATWPEV